MKYLKKFNENLDSSKVDKFIIGANDIINNDEQEYTSSDILSELGDLYNDLDMTPEDLRMVINSRLVNDDDDFVKIILDEVEGNSYTSFNDKLEKVVVYYVTTIYAGGSVSLEWYLTKEEAENGSCNGSVETFIGSDIYREAEKNSK